MDVPPKKRDSVTQILNAIQRGDSYAANDLLPLVYSELRELASTRMKRENSDHTLQPTALVHEAFIRLVGKEERNWDNRGHFFAAAADAMRRILVESARRRKALKRGGDRQRYDLTNVDATMETQDADALLSLDEALQQLAEKDPKIAKVVELRYFTGLSVEETAKALGISDRTAKRHWAYARAWLRRAMDSQPG